MIRENMSDSKKLTDFGVSEVFGVMLLLTITLVAAGVVSAYASGIGVKTGESNIGATIVASEIYTNQNTNCGYILFEHLSGNPLNLNRTEIHLSIRSNSKVQTSIKNKPAKAPIEPFSTGGSYRIAPGDLFVLNADGADSEKIYWGNPAGNNFCIEKNQYVKYEIIDLESKLVISTGMIPFS